MAWASKGNVNKNYKKILSNRSKYEQETSQNKRKIQTSKHQTLSESKKRDKKGNSTRQQPNQYQMCVAVVPV
jgi:hypothetical protein